MSCANCAPTNDAVNPNLPHVIRTCADCGEEYRIRETSNHGYGLNIRAGDKPVIPIRLTLNPLKSSGQFSRHGISFFAELLFKVDLAREINREAILAKLLELQEENEAFFVESNVLAGLDLQDPENEMEVHERLNANPKSIEWWGYLAAGFAHMAAEAVRAGDAATAAWAAMSAERFRTLAIFRTHFEEVVHVGSSAQRLVQLLAIWEAHRENSSEGFWQETFKHHAYAFGQLFSAPVTFLEDNAYVGGMHIDRKDARYVDFMLATGQASSAILVEIKTPKTPLLGRAYRGNAHAPSKELGGAVVQISDYCSTLQESAKLIARGAGKTLDVFNPRRVIVIGNYEDQLSDEKRRRSFELFRSSLSGIDIITFDELFRKVEEVAKLFNIVRIGTA